MSYRLYDIVHGVKLNSENFVEIYGFRQMMYMDPPVAKFSKNDGMISLLHSAAYTIYSRIIGGYD